MKLHRRVSLLLGALALWPALTRAQVITEFRLPTPGSTPLEIAPGPGGMWFSENGSNKVGRIGADGQLREFGVPRPPRGIVAGPDGNLWLTSDSFVSRMTPDGVATDFLSDLSVFGQSGSLHGYPAWITVGADDRIWFTDADVEGGRIGSIPVDASAGGQITERYIPAGDSDPAVITRGPDGALWFAVLGQYGDATINRAAPSPGEFTPSPGEFTRYVLSGVHGVRGIATGSDGNLWFTETDANRIGRITPSGRVTEFPVSGSPWEIAAGPDGNLWFTERAANKIGRITTQGDMTEYAVPTPRAEPSGISAGPDGNIWFTERGANQIGRITLTSCDEVSLCLGGGRFRVKATWQSLTGSGQGQAALLSSDTGSFWFFDPANVEIFVKVLDACPSNGRKWVFAAGLTNVNVVLTVTDTQTGLSRTYINPQGSAFLPIQDTDAFSTCP